MHATVYGRVLQCVLSVSAVHLHEISLSDRDPGVISRKKLHYSYETSKDHVMTLSSHCLHCKKGILLLAMVYMIIVVEAHQHTDVVQLVKLGG